ncbi:MAG: ester cyclase [Chloroflexi bacterium]|nr:ester cyclase [Chloroflexota bacterium]
MLTGKESCRQFMERVFNQGEIALIDELTAPDGIDHQEPPGTDYRAHLREVVLAMRTAFPDLHFEIHDMIAEGDIVAFRSTMTGTQLGPLHLGAIHLPPTQRHVTVSHLHYIRIVDGRSTDLWHQYDIPGLMRQLGIMPQRQPV